MAMLGQTIVALLLAVVLGTRGCEIGVWADIAARLRGGSASPPLCIVGLHHLDSWELRRRSRRGDQDERRRPEPKGSSSGARA
jgi:hypothetical protein